MSVKKNWTKLIYLIRGEEHISYEQFHPLITEKAERISEARGVRGVKLTITAGPPPRCSVIPFRKEKIAAVSVWFGSSSPEDGPLELLEELEMESGTRGFQVTEAVPVSYEKDWEDKKTTPGVGLLTIFKRRGGLSREEFLRRWHESHTPLSLKFHPLWNYNRNVVEGEIGTDRSVGNNTEGDNAVEGIVEEHFGERKDLLNVFRFFGPPWITLWRMMRVLFDSRSFIDYPTMEPYLITERWIKTPEDYF
jgi:hypothetical protein